ncbi:hypothetical protein AVEN_69751-1 [Araneus ventricosus]|uniref:Uncharacterized protein n=1 Tax=Araneus ventricosus TaxID=182803 RepID=A0A4Y2CZ13_ARAVE|nr:hypothetical protein AVEN_69751-1 [Araneus ventricosus]
MGKKTATSLEQSTAARITKEGRPPTTSSRRSNKAFRTLHPLKEREGWQVRPSAVTANRKEKNGEKLRSRVDADLTKNVDATRESSVCGLVHRDNFRYPSATKLLDSVRKGTTVPTNYSGLVYVIYGNR